MSRAIEDRKSGASAPSPDRLSHETEREEKVDMRQGSDPTSSPKRPIYKNPRFIVFFLALLMGALFGLRYYLHARLYETTDDAFIEGHVVQISPKVGGLVAGVRIEDNQEVKKGDPLVEIDPRDFEMRLAQARAGEASARGKLKQAEAQLPVMRANLGQAEAEVAVAETDAAHKETDLKRLEQLGDLVSKQESDNATAAAATSRAQLTAARRKAAAAEAQLAYAKSQIQTARAEVEQTAVEIRQTELDLSYAKILAPEEGRVTSKSVEPGMYVQPGQALFAIVPKQVWVVANFKETQLTQMRPGQPVKIRVDAYPGKTFQGHIDSIQAGSGARFSLLPPENATGNFVKVVQRFPVKIIFDEPPPSGVFLAPGMSARPEVRVR